MPVYSVTVAWEPTYLLYLPTYLPIKPTSLRAGPARWLLKTLLCGEGAHRVALELVEEEMADGVAEVLGTCGC